MIEFYWSEDKGLLDQKENTFLKKFKNPMILKNPDIEQLKLACLQCTLEEENDCYLVWNYSDSFEKLKDFLPYFQENLKFLLFLQNSKIESSSLLFLKKFFHNKKLKISKLNEKSKESYIFQKVSESKIFLSPDTLQYLNLFLPNNALEINSFFSMLDLYSSGKEINLQEVKNLFKFLNFNQNNFSFFSEYLGKNIEKWMKIFFENISNKELFKSFLSAFFYKIFEFKNFLELRKQNLDLLKVSKMMNRDVYFLNEYEVFFYKWNDKKDLWFENFIFNLFFLVDFCLLDFPFKIYLLRYFLIKNNL